MNKAFSKFTGLKYDLILFATLILFFIGIYSPIIFDSTPLNPDAQFIIPNLLSFSNLNDYLEGLVNLKTIDIQPVRDLTLWFDIRIYQTFGLNSFILQNIVIWSLCCIITRKIILQIFGNFTNSTSLLICFAFACYPLFVATIAWGIARKHLLAFLFTLLLTNIFLKKATTHFNLKDIVVISFLYSLAVFSQPITLLWPVWALLYLILQNSINFKNTKRLIALLFILMFIFAGLNFVYYEYSAIFALIYGSKTDQLFEFSDKILAVGHYVFQIFFPYLLSFSYSLGDWSTLIGLVFIVIILLFFYKIKFDTKFFSIWASFFIFPILIVLARPHTLFDTYLLLPTLATLILILKIKEPNRKLLIFMIIFFVSYSYYEACGWKSDIELTRRSFVRRPSCRTAIDFLKTSYENDHPLNTQNARTYFFTHDCLNSSSKSNIANLYAYLIYYSPELSSGEKIIKLDSLKDQNILANMLMASIMIKDKDFEKANVYIDFILFKWKLAKFRSEYIPTVARYIYPFCMEKSYASCMIFFNPFTQKKNPLQYR